MITSSAERPVSSILSTGMPRPRSRTVTELSGWIVTSIDSLCPASASSTEFATISSTRWWRPRGPVVPMYMPGRSRTGSSPSSTVMSLAEYPAFAFVFAIIKKSLQNAGFARPS